MPLTSEALSSLNPSRPFPSPSPSPSFTPLPLIIRFSLPIPDLLLNIPSPATTTAQSLNALIRPHLPRAHAASPLRLIAAGALLPPTTPISVSLRLPAPRPIPSAYPITASTTPAQDKSPPRRPISPAPAPAPIYIHCAISPSSAPRLSASALEAERAPPIQSPSHPPPPPSHTSSPLPTSLSTIHPAPAVGTTPPTPPLPPPPLGFDRLLSAGLSAGEIASLRAQFRAQTALAHTPDTMPDPAQLLVLEERWLEAGPRGGGTGGGGGGGGGWEQDEDETEGERGALTDMLWGNVMGFFWALGGVLWLVREEGVWSRRRQVAVVTGVLVNLAFGILKVTS